MMDERGKSDTLRSTGEAAEQSRGTGGGGGGGKGAWPRETRLSATRSGLRAGPARQARSSGYGKPHNGTGNSGSPRSCTTCTTSTRLRAAYLALKRDAAAGVDGETWQHYGQDLEANLQDSSGRLKRGAYRAKPVRRAYIPKADGRQRPLGVPALEDKIVQRAVVEVLNAIYETDFLGFSYGFRPGRSPHHALDALSVGILTKKVNWVLDADIRGFFDTLDHGWLVQFIEHRVADRRVVRLIQKWLTAGVLEDGQRTVSEVGTVQGGSVSPLLANIYLHYVFDLWVQRWRKTQAHGDVVVVRFADDFVVGFQHRAEAERFLTELRERFARFGLTLHPDKTRLIEFGRFADAEPASAGRREAGDLQLSGLHAQLREDPEGAVHGAAADDAQAVASEAASGEDRTPAAPAPTRPGAGAYLRAVVLGHNRYYGVPLNGPRAERVPGRWAGSGGASCVAGVKATICRGAGWGATSPAGFRRHVSVIPIRSCASPSRPKARAGCGNAARPDPWRGW